MSFKSGEIYLKDQRSSNTFLSWTLVMHVNLLPGVSLQSLYTSKTLETK